MTPPVATRGLPVGALRKALVFAMNALGYGALASSGELAPAVSVAFAVAMLLGWWWDAPRVNFARWQTPWTVVTLGAFALTIAAMFRTPEYLLTSAVHFVVFLAGAKLFQLALDKDYVQSMALSLLLLAAGTALNDGLSFGVSFGLYVLVSTTALTAHHLCVEVTEQRGVAGRSMRIERPVLAATVALATLVLAGALGFFFAFPRVGFGFFVQQNRGGDGTSGFSEGVQLGGGGAIEPDKSVVMRIRFVNYAPNPFEGLYMRGLSLDYYTGRDWTDEDDHPVTVERDFGGRGYVIGTSGGTWESATRETVVADVYLEPMDTSVLFAPGAFRAIGLPDDVTNLEDSLFGRALAADRTGQVNLTQRSRQGTMYRVYADPRRPNEEALRAARWPGEHDRFVDALRDAHAAVAPDGVDVTAPDFDPLARDALTRLSGSPSSDDELAYLALRYLQLPPSQVTPRMQALLEEAGLGTRTRHELVVELETRLRAMDYSLETPAAGADTNVVDAFLFDWRAGSCTYYATAMVVLLRAAGVPARIVNGYSGSEPNSVGGYHVVRQSHAHSWVEVFYPGLGWVRFDPTPAAPGERPLDGLRRRLNDSLDAMRLQWFRWVVEYDLEKQVNVVRNAAAAVRADDAVDQIDITQRLRTAIEWVARRYVALTLHVGLWIAAVAGLRGRARRRLPWAILDNAIGLAWAGGALAITHRFWPGGLTSLTAPTSLVIPVLGTLLAWLLRRDLFDDERTRARGGLDELSRAYADILRIAERELGELPASITADELVPVLDLQDRALEDELRAFLAVYVAHRFGGQAAAGDVRASWRPRIRALHRAIARNLRAQMDIDDR